eukprot:4698888-Heterocapsa_arctica.AAC.1
MESLGQSAAAPPSPENFASVPPPRPANHGSTAAGRVARREAAAFVADAAIAAPTSAIRGHPWAMRHAVRRLILAGRAVARRGAARVVGELASAGPGYGLGRKKTALVPQGCRLVDVVRAGLVRLLWRKAGDRCEQDDEHKLADHRHTTRCARGG